MSAHWAYTLSADVNSGHHQFTVNEHGQIVYGLGAIKGVGEAPAMAIVQARKHGGVFSDLFDFCHRVDIQCFNKRILEKLILSGACDALGPHRAALMAILEEAMRECGARK